MSPKNKKIIVGIIASISSLISGLLWMWYANLPSFEKIDQSFDQLNNVTFQDYGRESK